MLVITVVLAWPIVTIWQQKTVFARFYFRICIADFSIFDSISHRSPPLFLLRDSQSGLLLFLWWTCFVCNTSGAFIRNWGKRLFWCSIWRCFCCHFFYVCSSWGLSLVNFARLVLWFKLCATDSIYALNIQRVLCSKIRLRKAFSFTEKFGCSCKISQFFLLLTDCQEGHYLDGQEIVELILKILNNFRRFSFTWANLISQSHYLVSNWGAAASWETQSSLSVLQSKLEFVHIAVSVCQIEIRLSKGQLFKICVRIFNTHKRSFKILNRLVHVSHHVCMLGQVVQNSVQKALFGHNFGAMLWNSSPHKVFALSKDRASSSTQLLVHKLERGTVACWDVTDEELFEIVVTLRAMWPTSLTQTYDFWFQ